MFKKIGSIGRKSRYLQFGVGMFLIMAGLGLAWQTLAQAADDPQRSFSVRSEVSDQEMFGKQLYSERIPPLAAVLNMVGLHVGTQPGSGPVVPSRLRIPAIGIDTNVEQVELLSNGAMDVPTNIWNVGWLHSNPRPGDIGNAVIDGHKDSVRGSAIFGSLGELKVGDKLYVSDAYGYELTFEVYERASYPVAGADLDRIFGPTSEHQLNLITCDGTFVASKHTYDQRLVVYTRLVEAH